MYINTCENSQSGGIQFAGKLIHIYIHILYNIQHPYIQTHIGQIQVGFVLKGPPSFNTIIMAGRHLAPHLSDVTVPPGMPPLEPWQQKLMGQVQTYHEQAFMERRLLTPMVMNLPNPSREQLVAFVASAAQKCCGLNSCEAESLALASVQCPAVGQAADGIIHVSPYAWLYTKSSLCAATLTTRSWPG